MALTPPRQPMPSAWAWVVCTTRVDGPMAADFAAGDQLCGCSDLIRKGCSTPKNALASWVVSSLDCDSAVHGIQHVIHGKGMLTLRAEQNDFGILDRPHTVSGRPIKKVVLLAGVDRAVGVGHHKLPRDHVAPVRRVAGISWRPLEWCKTPGLCPGVAGAELITTPSSSA